MVHPSDPAVALMVLGAQVRAVGPDGERTLPVARFFQAPAEGARRLTVLEPAEIAVGIGIPAPAPGGRGTYLKAMERRVWAFALASVAVQITFDSNIVKEARMALGGVANVPWRLPSAEAVLQGRSLDEVAIGQAADLAAAGAKPLKHNGYKIALVKGIVREALTSLI